MVGVSLAPGAKPYASAYFKEGPFGLKGTLYTVGGTGNAPTFKAPFTSSSAKVEPGRAYGVTAVSSGVWPGVIGVESVSQDGGVAFAPGESKAGLRVTNRGTTNRTVRVTYSAGEKPGEAEALLPILRRVPVEQALGSAWSNVVAGVGWDLELAPGQTEEVVFGIARAALDHAKAYGGILTLEDLGGTKMRVRVPVSVEQPVTGQTVEVECLAGLWIGKFLFSKVSFGTNMPPVEATGMLKPTVLFFVDGQDRMTMLQRVSVVEDANGTKRLFREFDKAKAVDGTARRLSSLLLDPENQAVAATSGGFGRETTFTYEVKPKSAGNPFYHIWHPDHDGLNATYDGDAAEGRELWSVTNTVTVQFRDVETDQPFFSDDVDELRTGRVLWRVDGLRSVPIRAEGVFSIQRILPVSTLE